MEGPNYRETTRSLPPKPPTPGYKAGGYDPSERAYLVESTGSSDPPDCTFVLDASKDSPLLNPAVLLKNWGCLPATLTINGKTRQPGKDFRQGIRKGPLTDDLVVWIALEAQQPVEIALGRAHGKY